MFRECELVVMSHDHFLWVPGIVFAEGNNRKDMTRPKYKWALRSWGPDLVVFREAKIQQKSYKGKQTRINSSIPPALSVIPGGRCLL